MSDTPICTTCKNAVSADCVSHRLDIVERAKLALQVYETCQNEWPEPRVNMRQATEGLTCLVPELMEEVQRLRIVLIDGAVDAFKRG